MALTAQQVEAAWKWAVRTDPAIGSAFSKPQLVAAANATSDWIDLNQGATTSGPGYNNALPASPGFRAATTQQKSILFAAVALAKTGVVV